MMFTTIVRGACFLGLAMIVASGCAIADRLRSTTPEKIVNYTAEAFECASALQRSIEASGRKPDPAVILAFCASIANLPVRTPATAIPDSASIPG